MPLSSRRPSGLTLASTHSSSPNSRRFRHGRPGPLTLLKSGRKKSVQTIHKFCENVSEEVTGQIKKGCYRKLEFDENKKYSNLNSEEYTIAFNDKNIITTLEKSSGEKPYKTTDLKSISTGAGQNILSLLQGKLESEDLNSEDIVVKTNLLYKDLRKDDHTSALSRFINSVELQNKAAKIKIAPKIFDYFIYENKGRIYSVIVMEKIDGEPIQPTDCEEQLILNVLEELHNINIMHGDINPGNIIKVIGKDGKDDKYMLIDFDMAVEKKLKDYDKAENTFKLGLIYDVCNKENQSSGNQGSSVSGKTKKRKNKRSKKRTRKVKRGKKSKYSTVKR